MRNKKSSTKRNALLSLIVLCAVFVFGTSAVCAATYSYNSSGKSFSKAWSVTAVDDSDRTMKYGYNTTFINEDYIHTYHRTKAHTAYVKNSSKAQTTNGKAGKYAKPEITHASGTVYYEYKY